MAETRCISVKVSGELHGRVRAEQESLGITMNEYMEKVLTEHFQFITREEEKSMGPTRTLAFQVSEDLFQRLKNYLRKTNIKQKDFVIGLIKDELERFEMSEKEQSQGSGAKEQEKATQQDEDSQCAAVKPQEGDEENGEGMNDNPGESAAEGQQNGKEATTEITEGPEEDPEDEEGMGMQPVL